MALRYRTQKKYRVSYTYRGFNITWAQSTPTTASFTKQSPTSSTWTQEDKPGGA